MSANALIILAEGFEEIEAITPIDLLRRAHISVSVLGLNSTLVTGSHGIAISTEGILTPSTSLCDALILPGGPGHKHLLTSGLVLDYIKRMFTANNLCAAICAAPVVFAKAGILSGKKATCFPGMENQLAGALYTNLPVVSDGNVITSKGAGTAVPFSLEVISYLAGKESAQSISKSIVYTA
jgi:protein deglycase